MEHASSGICNAENAYRVNIAFILQKTNITVKFHFFFSPTYLRGKKWKLPFQNSTFS